MVHAALASQSWLHLSGAVLGSVVLAALTSLPNLWLALHFARTNRGTALMSAAMNSNTINLLGGLVIPALFIGTGFARGSLGYFGWLLDLTLLAVLAPLGWPGFRALLVLQLGTSFCFSAAVNLLPIYLQDMDRPSWLSAELASGLSITATAITAAFGMPFLGPWTDRHGPRGERA